MRETQHSAPRLKKAKTAPTRIRKGIALRDSRHANRRFDLGCSFNHPSESLYVRNPFPIPMENWRQSFCNF